MAANVFLIRCQGGDFERSVVNPIDLPDNGIPDVVAGVDNLRIWGVPETGGNNDYFKTMGSGALALFHNGEDYIGVGVIGETFTDPEHAVSEQLWDDVAFTNLFTVTEFERVSVPKAAVNRIFGYSESYTPAKVMRVADSRVSNQPEAIKLALEKYTAKYQSE